MSNDFNHPSEYDAVLGGENMAPTSAGVLGGIEGVKRRLLSQDIEHQISALSDALKYASEGLALVIEALDDSEEKVHKYAYKLLKERKELEVITALDRYTQQYYFLRFNGFYYIQRKSIYYSFLRFYQDGTVLAQNITSYDIDVIERATRWFNKDNNSVDIRGAYKIDGNFLNFSIFWHHHQVDYWGEIQMYGYIMSLNFYNHTTHYKKFYEYQFLDVPNIH